MLRAIEQPPGALFADAARRNVANAPRRALAALAQPFPERPHLGVGVGVRLPEPAVGRERQVVPVVGGVACDSVTVPSIRAVPFLVGSKLCE